MHGVAGDALKRLREQGSHEAAQQQAQGRAGVRRCAQLLDGSREAVPAACTT